MRCVTAHTSSAPSARNRIPMPPSQRAMNSGLGARILERSSATAHSCASTANAPPIPAVLPPSVAAIATRAAPKATRIANAFTSRAPLPSLTVPYRPLPPVTALIRISFHSVIDAHKPREPAHERADDREQRPRVHPAIEKPAPGAEQEDGECEIERHPEVRVALAVALARGIVVFLCGSHVAPGNLEANCQGGNAMWRLTVGSDYLGPMTSTPRSPLPAPSGDVELLE